MSKHTIRHLQSIDQTHLRITFEDRISVTAAFTKAQIKAVSLGKNRDYLKLADGEKVTADSLYDKYASTTVC